MLCAKHIIQNVQARLGYGAMQQGKQAESPVLLVPDEDEFVTTSYPSPLTGGLGSS